MHRAHLLESCHVRRELYRFGLGVPTDVLWFALPKSAPPTALDPRLHRQRDIVLTIERGEHYRAGLNVKTNNSLHRPGARNRTIPTIDGLCHRRPGTRVHLGDMTRQSAARSANRSFTGATQSLLVSRTEVSIAGVPLAVTESAMKLDRICR